MMMNAYFVASHILTLQWNSPSAILTSAIQIDVDENIHHQGRNPNGMIWNTKNYFHNIIVTRTPWIYDLVAQLVALQLTRQI